MEEKKQLENFDFSSYFANANTTLALLKRLNRFPDYSIQNRFLISEQRPSAIAVTNFSKLKELGHTVKPNERPIKVLVPGTNSNKKIPGIVYDISQTTLPIDQIYRLYPNRYFDFNIQQSNDRLSLNNKLVKFANTKNVNLDPADFFNPFDPYDATKSLIDEVSNLQVHENSKNIHSRKFEELQSRLTSFLIHDSFAMNTSNTVTEYVDDWSNEKGQKINQLSSADQHFLLENVMASTDYIITSLNGINFGMEESRAAHFSKPAIETIKQELDRGPEL